jgi:uncharacterized protein (TIGR04222 family)
VLKRWFLIVALGVFVGIWPAAPALAAAPESITSYDTKIDVQSDASIRVTETIAYDFGASPRHGIVRQIPDQCHYDDLHDRRYPIDQVSVQRNNANEPFFVDDSGGATTITIGDVDHTVTGTQVYVIGYTVHGVINHFADHEELFWNVIGPEWTVPIRTATATVSGPEAATRVGCFSGATGSQLGCAQSGVADGVGTFGETNLGNGDGMTVVVAFPPGSVSTVAPILVDRHDPAAAFHPSALAVGVGAGLAWLGIAAALGLVWRYGRDRRYVGLLPGLTPEKGESAVEERRPLTGGPPVSVEFGPPDKLRPGQVGTLIDEQANVVDVTATIVDLAVRKYLRITEVEYRDWELTKLRDAGKELQPYERSLFEAVFRDGDTAKLSHLKGHFAPDLAKVQRQLYDDMVAHGWYLRSPAATRRLAVWSAILALLGAIVVTVVLALTTHVALIGVGLVIAAIAFLTVAHAFPARTGRGSAVLERVRGFRLYIATAEADQIAFQERVHIFSEFLPYAMVFGLVDRWARIFADLADFAPDGLDWYRGTGAFTVGAFAGSFGQFSTMAAGSVATAAVSAGTAGSSGFSGFGGGGFSGGGVGGGGGGSW